MATVPATPGAPGQSVLRVGTSGYQTVQVGAGTFHELRFHIKGGSRTRVTWDYGTAHKDIAFQAQFMTPEGQGQVVSPYARVDCFRIPECGSFETSTEGMLTLTWFNTYSLFTGKTLTYSVGVDENLPDFDNSTGPHGTYAVRTVYGCGTVINERSDGVYVVKLAYGTAFLHPSAILTSVTNHGKYAAKTPHQLERLAQLCTLLFTRGRDLTAEERRYCDEQVLLRTLRANEWDVTNSHAALDQELRWRFFEVRPLDLLSYDMELFRPYVTAFMAGHDKEGHPVITIRFGKPEPMATETKMQTMLFLMERALQLLPAGEEQLTWVLDFRGFAQCHLDYRFAKWGMHIMQTKYPERLGHMVIINTHPLFQMFWKFVRPLLQTRTRGKVVWLKRDTDEDSINSLQWLMEPAVVAAVLAEYPDTSLLAPTAAEVPVPLDVDTTAFQQLASANKAHMAAKEEAQRKLDAAKQATAKADDGSSAESGAGAGEGAGATSGDDGSGVSADAKARPTHGTPPPPPPRRVVLTPTQTNGGISAMVMDAYGVARPAVKRSTSGKLKFQHIEVRSAWGATSPGGTPQTPSSAQGVGSPSDVSSGTGAGAGAGAGADVARDPGSLPGALGPVVAKNEADGSTTPFYNVPTTQAPRPPAAGRRPRPVPLPQSAHPVLPPGSAPPMGPGSNSAIVADSDSDDDASPMPDAEDIEAAGGMSPDAGAAALRAKRAAALQEADAARVASRLGAGTGGGDLEVGVESEEEEELNAAVAELEDELLRHGSGGADVLDPEAGDLDVSLSQDLQAMVGSDVDVDLTSGTPSPVADAEAGEDDEDVDAGGVLDPEVEAAAAAAAAAGTSSRDAGGEDDDVSEGGDGSGEGDDATGGHAAVDASDSDN